MFVNRAYYFLKPVLPWRLRLVLRRWRANRRRRSFADVWPVDPKAGRTPPAWPGWPDGKRFALVLTHDVELKKGVSRVRQLRDLELKYGFRSCFNFVPEGEYRVPDAVRDILDQAGFEVGVHGLEHDGKLYSSKKEFAFKASRIRQYLQKWNASGFRSPLMQHRLGWQHALGAEYDTSTFDSDPFEPESDGTGTIFPFWVPGPNGAGYVELPYTLVQDFNLFGVLREPNIDVWKRKIDWIAEHSGMALLNTHPDYMWFDGKQQRDEYPVSLYEDFLRYVRDKYDGSYWGVLPREVARYYREAVPLSSRNTRKKICMVAYSLYESDNRIRRYAETLAKRGDQVDVIALSRHPSALPVEEIDGVTVYRIQHREHNERSKWTYAWRLLRFLMRSSRALRKLHARNRYDVIHIHNMPDFLVFAAWFPKVTGAKLILDIHDVVPELFANKFSPWFKSAYVGLLKVVEKLSVKFVDHVIVSNHLWLKTVVARSAPEEKCSVLINHVDPEMFSRHARTRTDDKFIILFPGSLQWHQGVDIAIEAFARVKQKVPNAEFHIYCGSGGLMQDELRQLAQRLGLQESIRFNQVVPLDQMAQVIANSDLGVVPKRADSFGNEAYSTKIMEFMSQGVPVVASRTKIDAFYFEEGIVHFFRPGDSQSMAQAMLEVIGSDDLYESLARRGYDYVKRHGWDQKKKEYLDLIDSLSTEIFTDVQVSGVQPPLGSVAADIPQESHMQPIADPPVQEVDTLAVRLVERSSVSSLESR
jgi:glycosyltransferase involved in cell wall biosynthesis/peptidoglycan/xylan/chitin deacetylase (PgdA/CDA1 family)